MRKFLATSIIGLFCCGLPAQKIIYKPVFIDQCTDSIAGEQLWRISDSTRTLFVHMNFISNEAYLPEFGRYYLFYGFGEDPKILDINTYGIIIDTLYTMRIRSAVLISNPPSSHFLDCNGLANGRVIDYYCNGMIRLKGSFSNGQPIDTIHEFYRSGGLKELYVPKKNHIRRILYYENGQIKSDFNASKKYSKEYYDSGELMTSEKWKRNYHTRKVEFYKNGHIKLEESQRLQKRYSSNGFLESHTTRKEVFRIARLFYKYGTNRFKYQYIKFDSSGNKLVYIKYRGGGYPGGYFPDNITLIDADEFKEILIYRDGKEFQMIKFEYQKDGDVFVKKLILFEKNNDVWVEKETMNTTDVYNLLSSHLNNYAL